MKRICQFVILAKDCNIAQTTLYSIIQRDTDIRYEFALRIANSLDIPIGSICNDLSYDSDTNLSILFSKHTLEIAKIFNHEEFLILDRLIAKFYVLDDESRKEIFKIIAMKHEVHDVPEHLEKLKKMINIERR